MVDLTQFLTVGGLAAFLVVLTQALKAYAPPADTRYIPYATLGLGILFGLVFAGATGHLAIAADWLSYGVGGFMAGLTAIGGYEASLDKLLNSSTTPKSVAPPQQAGVLRPGDPRP